jgi:hypothetical protein
MPEILATMTVKEAAEYLAETNRTDLRRWGETFGIPLKEFHTGHIRTYQIDRAQEVEATIVDREVAALLKLLRALNLSAEIERFYRPLVEATKLKAVKPDDGRCLYRDQFIKKDGTLSKIKRQCSRQAQTLDGHLMTLCAEHQREVDEVFRRVMDKGRRSVFVPGPKVVQ